MTSLKKAALIAVSSFHSTAGNLMLAALVFALLALPQATHSASSIWDGSADTTWYTSDTSKTNFTISTAEELAGLALLVNGSANNGAYNMRGKIITLADDILLNDTTDWQTWGSATVGLNNWTAIGTSSSLFFRGTFDGAGHVVSGLFISRTNNYQGLFGYTYSLSKISNIGVENFYIKGNGYVGGLVGYNYSGTISNSYAIGNVNASETSAYVGGLAGYNSGTISNSYATGSVSASGASASVGGLVGRNSSNAISGGTIINSYAAGSVSASGSRAYVGGLVGGNYIGTIINSYAAGSVSASGSSARVGGLVGDNSSSTVINSYYDMETSGHPKAVGNWEADTTGKAEGKSTDDMKEKSAFDEWDFDIWEIIESNYPTFIWQNPNLNPNNLVKAIISAIPDQTWTGEKLTPKSIITFGGITLTEDVDFEYSYKNNWLSTDTAALIITGKGDYTGSKTAKFYIAPFASCSADFFAGGEGTVGNPYQISNAKELDAIHNCVGSANSGKYFALTNDISLTDYLFESENGWKSIGSSGTSTSFYGKIDGKGHKITGLWIDRQSENYIGLFGYLSAGAIVENLGVEMDDAMGGVKGYYYVGGLIGYMSGGSMINSYAAGNVSGSGARACVGGLVGTNSSGTIINSYAAGNVSGSGASANVGGLIGDASGAISNSYAAGTVSGAGPNVGGLIGRSSGAISGSYYDKTTSVGKAVGNWEADTTGKAEGKFTADMKLQSTFIGWDFDDIWEVAGVNYPTFIWQNSNHLVSAVIAAISSQVWTGEKLTPKPIVTFGGSTLTEGADFEYSYKNNLLGTDTAALIITGKGGYIGSKTIKFYIAPAACSDNIFAGGTGTSEDPYQITDAKELDAVHNCIGDSYRSKYFALTNDISLTGYISGTESGWKPIGTSSGTATYFYGKVNGNGHKVTDLWIDRQSEDYVGLFGYLYTGAKIENLGVEMDDSKGGVKGNERVGGLAGQNYGTSSTISNSYAMGNVSGNDYVGGLVGGNISISTIINSYATGNVSGSRTNAYVGGLVGDNSSSEIINSYATGNVSGSGLNAYVGGLVGINSNGTIINSYAAGSVSATGSRVGGLVGNNGGTISNSYYDMETSGRPKAVGNWEADTTGKAEGKSTDDMKDKSVFAEWDFNDIWEIAGVNYPTFIWQNSDPNYLLKATIAAIPDQAWTGGKLTPKPIIILGTDTLKEDVDFEYSYKNNWLNSDSATLIITGKGDYSGKKTVKFYIAPAACGVDFFAGGEGTVGNPYQISNAKELDALHNCVGIADSSKYFILTNDISLTGYISSTESGWKPIGTTGSTSTYFYGKVNGYGYKVTGLWIDRQTESYVGLFGYLSTRARVENLGVEVDDAKGGIRGYYYVGGLVGINSNGTIINSYAAGSVSATGSRVGGLVGNNGGTISNSYATGSVSGDVDVGGLVGSNSGTSATINSSYATGSVSGMYYSNVGGLVGYNSGTISNGYAAGSVVSGRDSYIGGLIGYRSSGAISGSYYDKITSEVAKAIGNWGADTTGKAEGKSTSDMKLKSTFAGWDFDDIWGIYSGLNKGYPILLIWKNNLSLLDIDPIGSLEYTGNTLTPELIVKIDGTALVKGADYELLYSNNVNVGTAKITITGVGAYSGEKTATFQITPKELTVAGVTAQNKTYDGADAATLYGATLNGAIGGDEVSLVSNGVSANFADSSAGEDIVVSVLGNFAISGAASGNYTLTQPDLSELTANITPKELTVAGITAENKVYDGTKAATLSGATLNGAIGGDDVSLTNATVGTFASSDVGTGISVSATFGLSGAASGNYTLTQPDLSGLKANITPKELTITGITANKEYDGAKVATLIGAVLNGVIDAEEGDVSLVSNGVSANFENANVGEGIAVSVIGNFAISGSASVNYTLTQPDLSELTASITRKPIAIPAAIAGLVYDGALKTGVSAGAGYALSGNVSTNAGNYTATATLDGNHKWNDGATADKTIDWSITKATPEHAIPSGLTAIYGQTLSAVSLPNGWAWDDASDIVGAVDAQNHNATFTPVDTDNYNVAGEVLSITVTPKTLTITGITANKEYDGAKVATLIGAALNGAIGGDDVTLVSSGVSATFEDANVGEGIAVSVIGNFAISGSASVNYTLTQPDLSALTASITRKPIAIPAAIAGLVYDGALKTGVSAGAGYALSGNVSTNAGNYTATATLDGNHKWNDGATADKTIDWSITKATPEHAIPSGLTAIYGQTLSAVSLPNGWAWDDASDIVGAVDAQNHNATFTPVDTDNYNVAGEVLSITVTPKTLTITGITANKEYDGAKVATLIGAALNGAIGGDDVTLVSSGVSATFEDANVGEGIAVSVIGNFAISGSASVNYTLTQPDLSALTANITRKPIAVPIAIAGLVYDGALKTGVSAGAGYALSGNVSTNAGNYTATATLDGNHKWNDGATADKTIDWSITKATPEHAIPSGLTAIYGQTLSAVSLPAGWVWENSSDLVGTVGSQNHNATFTPVDTDNYNVAGEVLSIIVTPKELTITGIAANKEYDGAKVATLIGATLNGAIGGDDVSLVSNGVSANFENANVGENKTVLSSGNFAISGSASGNYTLTQPDLSALTANITRKPIVIPTAIAGLVYDGALKTGVSAGAGYALLGNTNTNAGDYTATATLDGNHKWNDGATADKTIDWSIAKAAPEHAIPSGLTAIYGQTLSAVSLPAGWVWGELGTTSVGNVGTQTFRASFIPEDTLNYYGVIEDLIITVTEPTPIVISANSQIPRIAVQANSLQITAQAATALEVYNAKGGLVLSQKFGAGNHVVSLAGLPRGVYLAKAKFGSESKTVRVMVK